MTDTDYREHARLLAQTLRLQERVAALTAPGRVIDAATLAGLHRDLARHRLELLLYRARFLSRADRTETSDEGNTADG
jgi:hypothetical protein